MTVEEHNHHHQTRQPFLIPIRHIQMFCHCPWRPPWTLKQPFGIACWILSFCTGSTFLWLGLATKQQRQLVKNKPWLGLVKTLTNVWLSLGNYLGSGNDLTVAMRQDANSSLLGDGSVCDPPMKPIPLPLLAPFAFQRNIDTSTDGLTWKLRRQVDIPGTIELCASGCATKGNDGMSLLDGPCLEADGMVAWKQQSAKIPKEKQI